MTKKKFEDIIAEQGRLVYTSEGDSMFPTVMQRDLLVIERAELPLAIGDIPLYKRRNGQYVLHRIVGMNGKRYITRGDNRELEEKGVSGSQIIGVLTAIVRGGRTYPVGELKEVAHKAAMDLVYLLSCVVNGEPPDKARCADMDMVSVYCVAQNHFLTSAAAFALEAVTELPRPFDQAKKKAIRKLALFEIERTVILKEFEAAGIWYLPLKGILIKDSYPKAAMREMSDNDILVDPSRMGDIRGVMERLGYTCEHYGQFHHDTYIKPPTLQFELHHSLFDDEIPLMEEYFRDIGDKLIKDGYARSMTDEDFYIYLICHMFKHYSHGGTGLRSLLDVYIFLRSHEYMDNSYLTAELDKLGLADYERTVSSLGVKVFTGEKLDQAEQEELDYYIFSGGFGNEVNAEKNRVRYALKNDDSRSAKLRYLRRRVFPSQEYMKKRYPLAAKHKALYPLVVVYRPIKAAVTHPKKLLDSEKNVLRFKKKD